MDLWQEQWAKMEKFLLRESQRALQDVANWSGVSGNTFSREYLDGLADGMRRAVNIVEAFRIQLPKTELEAKVEEMREFEIDEEW